MKNLMKAEYTQEAKFLIDKEGKKFSKNLYKIAEEEALQSRGEPIEVTASDVKRAVDRLTWKRTPLRRMTDLTLKLYFVLGFTIFVFGIFFPYIKKIIIESDPLTRVSFSVAVVGLALMGISLFSRFYLENLSKRKMNRRDEELKDNEDTLIRF